MSLSAYSKGLYLTNEQFLSKAFGEEPYESKMLWLKGETKLTLQGILNRKTVGLRQRYWQLDNRTAWVFNEIGKELPITIGVVIENNQIKQMHVLEYRESRGGEVRHDFFLKQFFAAKLNQKKKLTQSIDGITGATLSVRSMKRVARSALFLHNALLEITP